VKLAKKLVKKLVMRLPLWYDNSVIALLIKSGFIPLFEFC